MTKVHHLTENAFSQLAGGDGGVEAIAALRTAQLSKHLVLIHHLLAHWPDDPAARDAIAVALDRARTADPGRFADIMSAPLVGAWSGIATRAMKHGKASWPEFGHLAALATVACAAVGVDTDAEVPVRDGIAVLPGLGAVDLGTHHDGRVRLAATGGRLTVDHQGGTFAVPEDPAAEAGAHWEPVRHLDATTSGRRLRLGLDDVDPYRHGHHAPPATRLSGAEVDRWHALFTDTWRLLVTRLPHRADEMTAGLRTLVPLVQSDEGTARSATLRHAFGVFGLTRPPSAAEFAVTLVHEFQHSKLSAILDLVRLTDPDHRGRYFAPWRTDPRPLAGLLQGVYAFVGVADTWRALRDVDGLEALAGARFAEARLQIDHGLTSVEESGGLTTDGQSFVAGLRRTADALLSETVPAQVAREAEETLALVRQQWVEHNYAAI
jgi:uncharacterized protein